MVCRHGRQVAKTQERELPTEQPDGDKLFDDDVDEFLGYDDDFDDLAAVELVGHFFIGLGKLADFVLCNIDGHADPAAQLAVYLDGHLQLFFSGKIGIKGRP